MRRWVKDPKDLQHIGWFSLGVRWRSGKSPKFKDLSIHVVSFPSTTNNPWTLKAFTETALSLWTWPTSSSSLTCLRLVPRMLSASHFVWDVLCCSVTNDSNQNHGAYNTRVYFSLTLITSVTDQLQLCPIILGTQSESPTILRLALAKACWFHDRRKRVTGKTTRWNLKHLLKQGTGHFLSHFIGQGKPSVQTWCQHSRKYNPPTEDPRKERQQILWIKAIHHSALPIQNAQ